MVDDSMFPLAPAPSLTDAQVISYLVHLKSQGWDVFKRSPSSNHQPFQHSVLYRGYHIELADKRRLIIENPRGDQWFVSVGIEPSPIWPVGGASDIGTLQALVRKELGQAPPAQSALLYQTEPLTNLSKIANLLGQSVIQAVFDPYIDDRTFVVLATILGLSNATVDPRVRFLTATSMTIPSASGARKGLARLTQIAADAWFKQMGVQGAVRHNNYQGHQRRFMLLSGRQTLILGPSLNNPFTNEHVSVEHKPENQTFFDSEWTTGTAL